MNAHNKLSWKKINDRVSTAHFLSAQDEQLIYLKKWHAPGTYNSEKVIFLFHDLCQYHGRFESLVKWYQENDASVTFISMDFVGHGLSSGTRGHFDQFDFLVKDILYLLENEEKNANHQWFVLAHGLGALSFLDLMNKYPAQFGKKINGLILSNFIFELQTPSLAKWVTGPLSSIASRVRLKKIFLGREITSDDHEMTRVEQDSLIVHRPTLAAMEAIKDKTNEVYRDAYFLDWPILVLQSELDKYLLEKGMAYFLMGVKKNLLTEKSYSNMKRDLYNETDKVRVFKDILEWINAHEKQS